MGLFTSKGLERGFEQTDAFTDAVKREAEAGEGARMSQKVTLGQAKERVGILVKR